MTWRSWERAWTLCSCCTVARTVHTRQLEVRKPIVFRWFFLKCITLDASGLFFALPVLAVFELCAHIAIRWNHHAFDHVAKWSEYTGHTRDAHHFYLHCFFPLCGKRVSQEPHPTFSTCSTISCRGLRVCCNLIFFQIEQFFFNYLTSTALAMAIVASWYLFGSLHWPIPVRCSGNVFARKMHSATKFAMTVLSKRVTHVGSTRFREPLGEHLSRQRGCLILRPDLWICTFNLVICLGKVKQLAFFWVPPNRSFWL
jgi:hypothetical protein